MKVKLFANYGVLSAEKKTTYSMRTPIQEEYGLHEEVWVELPDDLKAYETVNDDIVVTLEGEKYLMSQVLTTSNNQPALIIPGSNPYATLRVRKLKVVKPCTSN